MENIVINFQNTEELVGVEQDYDKVLVLQQFLEEVHQYLGQFSEDAYGIRKLSSEAGVNSKTLRRILRKENFPTFQTVFKVLSVIYATASEVDIFKRAPSEIQKYLRNKNPNCLKDCTPIDIDLCELMYQNPIIAELIVLAGANDLHLSAVSFKYGEYGVNCVERLLKLKVFSPISKDIFSLSPHLPNFDAKTLKFLGLRLTERFSKPQLSDVTDKNIIAFYSEGLSEEGLKKWIEIDTEAFHQKMAIARNPKFKGAIASFTFNTTDTLLSKD